MDLCIYRYILNSRHNLHTLVLLYVPFCVHTFAHFNTNPSLAKKLKDEQEGGIEASKRFQRVSQELYQNSKGESGERTSVLLQRPSKQEEGYAFPLDSAHQRRHSPTCCLFTFNYFLIYIFYWFVAIGAPNQLHLKWVTKIRINYPKNENNKLFDIFYSFLVLMGVAGT